MAKLDAIEEIKNRIREKQSTPEYQQACQRFQAECDRLALILSQLQLQELTDLCDKNTVRTERAVGSTLHRGFYCPSPVFDIFVGNVKRGVVRKRSLPVDNPSHTYGFDEAGRLLWCKSIYNGEVGYTEYLLYRDERVYGIMVSSRGEVLSITEEVYSDGRIVSYLYGLCLFPDAPVKVNEVSAEYYTYDELGLCASQWHSFNQILEQPIYQSSSYRYEREDGYLTSYTNGEYTYKVRIRRKA